MGGSRKKGREPAFVTWKDGREGPASLAMAKAHAAILAELEPLRERARAWSRRGPQRQGQEPIPEGMLTPPPATRKSGRPIKRKRLNSSPEPEAQRTQKVVKADVLPELLPQVGPEFFKGKQEFGSCIVVLVDSKDVPDVKSFVPKRGFLQCGACGLFDEVDVAGSNQYKKYGAFMCLTCVDFLGQVLRVAKKAEALECSGGEGSCVLAPEENMCEACFSRRMLLMLDLKDDVYFKLWRSVPPEATQKVPCVPPPCKLFHESRGKVLLVSTLGGKILHVCSNVMTRPGKEPKTSKEPRTASKVSAKDTTTSKKNTAQGRSATRGRGRPKKEEEPKNSIPSTPPQTANPLGIDISNAETPIIPWDKTVKVFPVGPNATDVETEGFPVVISSELNAEPPGPLCFSCGSSGINQLIFCCKCVQAYHPYCTEDDLLLAAYLAHISSPDPNIAQRFRQWKCHRCITCGHCGQSYDQEEDFIGCSICISSFHIKCARKMPLKPNDKDRDKWVCSGCMKCSSCSIPLKRGTYRPGTNSELLCLECFRQQQKGSYCPICLKCYDDDDWDSKMMECDKCQRWIHAACENLNDEGYYLLSGLPESIPYVCRICVDPGAIVCGWRVAVENEMKDGCLKVLDMFHKKSVGVSRKRRTLSFELDEEENGQMSFCRQLFSPVKRLEENGLDVGLAAKFNLKPCTIKLEDLNVLRYIENAPLPHNGLSTPVKKTCNNNEIMLTPTKMSTPNRIATTFTAALKSASTIWYSVSAFRDLALSLIPPYFMELTNSEKYSVQEDKLIVHFEDTMKQVFPWWREDLKREVRNFRKEFEEECPEDEEDCTVQAKSEEEYPNSIVFEQVLWDSAAFLDFRKCSLCQEHGDFPINSCGRLIPAGLSEWVHVNCVIWSSEVWEEKDGELQQVEIALQRGRKSECAECGELGATLNCCAQHCRRYFHFLCSLEAGCALQVDKRVFCPQHLTQSKGQAQSVMHVTRKVFVPSWKRKLEAIERSSKLKLFLGSIRVESFGYLLPLSVKESYILPVDFHLSFVDLNSDGKDQFKVLQIASSLKKPKQEILSQFDFQRTCHFSAVVKHTSKARTSVQLGLKEIQEFCSWIQNVNKYVDEFYEEWTPVYIKPKKKNSRKSQNTTNEEDQKVYHAAIALNPEPTDPSILRALGTIMSHSHVLYILEQLPGAETICRPFKYFPQPEDEIPAVPLPSGCCRFQPYASRRPFDMFNWLRSKYRGAANSKFNANVTEESEKAKGLPIPMRFRNLKERAGKDLVVLPSEIHGRGLFARRDFEVGEMLIEYAGELIRSVLCDLRERKYESRGIGCYMFRVNRELVVDATMKGNAARFINHSCDPNCESKVVRIFGKDHILIFALRNIQRGEELTYDYKFEREIDGKLPCSCGTKRCRRYLN